MFSPLSFVIFTLHLSPLPVSSPSSQSPFFFLLSPYTYFLFLDLQLTSPYFCFSPSCHSFLSLSQLFFLRFLSFSLASSPSCRYKPSLILIFCFSLYHQLIFTLLYFVQSTFLFLLSTLIPPMSPLHLSAVFFFFALTLVPPATLLDLLLFIIAQRTFYC